VKSGLDIEKAKKLLRETIWTKLESEHVARFPLPCFGRIPNFAGSEKAAEQVRLLPEWRKARVVFVSPDYAQQKVRENALLDGKVLVMASPKLRHGYVVIYPDAVKGFESFSSTIRGAFKYGKAVPVQEMPRPDLIVEGSVAVDMQGHRLGKGGGYGDVEISTLKAMFGNVPVVTTAHDMQVVDSVPFDRKDEKVSVIVTPTRTIRI
jgi:5-formyltetrahydrofolate cyclo-ligase